MNSIELTVVYEDDDGILMLAIRASSPSHSVYHETYLYPEDLVTFSEELKVFPRNQHTDVTLESGSKDPGHHDYIRVRAFLHEPNGSSLLEIDSIVHGDATVRSNSHFTMAGYPADFNRLGTEIATWIKKPDQPMRVEWDTF